MNEFGVNISFNPVTDTISYEVPTNIYIVL
jgi:hypothetical protein